MPKVPVAGQDHRGRLHLHVPQQRRPRAVRRHRGRARRPCRGLGRTEVADRGPGRHRQGDRAAAEQDQGQRHHRRRLVRPQAVRRPRDRGRQDLQGDGQAGPADVAPRRRAAPGPGAPDVHLADPGDVPRRPGAQLRAAPHQRRDRLQPRAAARCSPRSAAELPAGLGQPRLRRVDLRADPGAALQLRRRHPAAQRDRHPVQHRQHAQHLLTRRTHGQRAGDRPAGPGDGQGPAGVPAGVRQGQAGARRAREGRRGRQLGPVDAGRAPLRASRSTRSTRAAPPSSSRSTAVPRRSTARSARASPARGSPRRSSRSTPAWWSTRRASRRR